MTPEAISTAVLAALTIAEKAGVNELTKKAVGNAYDSLKSVIHRKFGGDSGPAKTLAELEADPASEGQKIVLTEQLKKVGLTDPELAAAAQALLTAVHDLPQSGAHTQTAIGTDIAQADRGGTAKVIHYAPLPTHHD